MSRLSDSIGQFATIPHSFIESSAALSSDAFRMFVTLRYYTNGKSGEAFPKFDTLQEITGMSRRRIARALTALVASGWITKTRRFSKSTKYTLRIPPPISNDGVTNTISNDGVTAISNPVVTAISNDGGATNKTDSNQTDKNQTDSILRADARPAPKKPPAHQQTENYRPIYGALQDLCQIDAPTRLGKVCVKLDNAAVTAADVERFRAWWFACDWRGQKGQAPTPEQVTTEWPKMKAWNGKPPVTNAVGGNGNHAKQEMQMQNAREAMERVFGETNERYKN